MFLPTRICVLVPLEYPEPFQAGGGGDDYPEMIVDWYKQHGYHFLALSDHNVLAQGNKWIDAATNKGGAVALDKYLKRFGTNWVQLREKKDRQQVRLKTLSEYRKLFE